LRQPFEKAGKTFCWLRCCILCTCVHLSPSARCGALGDVTRPTWLAPLGLGA
jgi:hypothetical protein